MAGPPRPQVMLTGARLRAFSGPDLVARGRAARLAYFRDTGEARADEAWLELLPVPGVTTGLVATHGPVQLRAAEVGTALTRGEALASGGVVLQTHSGVRAETPSARYEQATGQVRGDASIRASQGHTVLTAEAFVFDLMTEELDFSGNVHTQAGVATP